MPKPPKPIPLSADLERSVIAALLSGGLPPDLVVEGELSKPARAVTRAYLAVVAEGYTPDWRTVYVYATDVLGAERDSLQTLLREAKALSGDPAVGLVLRKLRERRVLLEVHNAVTEQLAGGTLDVGAIQSVLAAETSVNPAGGLLSMGDRLEKEGVPPYPTGVPLLSLPEFSQRVGPLFGMWALAGEPKVGKSTFAWQVAVEAAKTIPVLYYDFENGFAVIANRLLSVVGGDVTRVRQATAKLFYRSGVGALESDLSTVGTPSLVVIDSIQKLPSSLQYRREGLDKWLHRLEAAKQRGHHLFLVSEVPRAQYGLAPHMGIFKETGEVEYTAEVGLQLVLDGGASHLHVVAHRHRPVRGRVVSLRRTHDWWFSEIA